jgi:hypothetical protein
MFKLSQEDVEALETDAPAHIPKLLARVYHQAMVNMNSQLSRVIPAMIERREQVTKKNLASRNKFYAAWPDLKPELHSEVVDRYARLYRQTNPSASFDQMVQELGPLVMIAAKVVPGQHLQQPATNGNGGQPVLTRPTGRPPSPFRPAMGGPASPPQQGAENPWMGLAPGIDDSE